jgi:tetratricopeptide (TPR) repeat protein
MFLRSLVELGNKCFQADDISSAMDCYGYVTLMAPAQNTKGRYASVALYKMGMIYSELQAFRRAISMFDQALDRNPGDRNCCLAKIECLFKLGDIDEAIEFQDKAFEDTCSRKLYLYNYSGTLPRDEISRRHEEWGRAVRSFVGPPASHSDNAKDPNKVLSIGYISPDLRRNVVAFFLEAALRNRNAERTKSVLYFSGNRPSDDYSEVLKGLCDGWRDVRHKEIPQVQLSLSLIRPTTPPLPFSIPIPPSSPPSLSSYS